jgi:CheY-like chemotaxis protein/CheY-specific phosphatase CheX
MSTLSDKKILVAEDDPMVSRLLKQALTKAGASVDVVGDGEAAKESLRSVAYDAFVTDWMMPKLDGIELVRYLKAGESRPYIVLVSALNIPDAKNHAIGAGADEFFTKPLVPAKLVEALAAALARRPPPRPIRQGTVVPGGVPAGRQGAPGAATRPVAQAAPKPKADEHPLASTQAWLALPESVRQVLSDMLQAPTTVVAGASGRAGESGVTIRSLLPLIDSEHQMELHLLVEASKESAIEVAKMLLGDRPPDDDLRDLIGEAANIVAGWVKTSFSKEGFPFTLGIASNAEAAYGGDYAISRTMTVAADRVRLLVTVGVRQRQAISLAGNELREGMVLAESLFTDSGALILPVGTRLSGTARDRLQKMFRERRVLVCVPEVRG